MQEVVILFLEKVESLYSKIDKLLVNAGNKGYLTKDDMLQLLGYFHTLKSNATLVEAYKYIAFVQDIESFIKRFDKLKVENFGTSLIDLCIDTSYASKDIVTLECEGNLDWGEFMEITNDILKEYNNVIYHQSERFFENSI